MSQRFIHVLLTLCILMGGPAFAVDLSGPARVVDGDTIEVAGQRVRLLDIDAFESGQYCQDAKGRRQHCGKFAELQLVSLVGQNPVRCTGTEFDRYNRLLARCAVAGADLGEAMVASGMALTFDGSGPYTAAEARARRTGQGFWAGTFEHPRAFRAARWQAGAQVSPEGCPIKGNISRKGDRIYHTPYSRHYARTRINLANGERWFCSEREALDAGWRAPLR
ncbi:MAG: thermonuclease family protein [Pseudomonadota bacterium]